MKKGLVHLFAGLGLATAILASAQHARATLGGSVGSVESDRKVLSAVRGTTTTRSGYTVQEFTSNANVVREYVSSSGIVFGVAWNGMSHPDLDALLGSYAGEYLQALRQAPHKPGRRSLRVKTERVVVEKWGHMRNLQGRAYVPSLIPPGVGTDEIK
jgi:hypothetical protein